MVDQMIEKRADFARNVPAVRIDRIDDPIVGLVGLEQTDKPAGRDVLANRWQET